jgi:hypothetical protein
MAEVREKKDVPLGELAANLDSGKDRTIPFAVTAGVADRQLACGFDGEFTS